MERWRWRTARWRETPAVGHVEAASDAVAMIRQYPPARRWWTVMRWRRGRVEKRPTATPPLRHIMPASRAHEEAATKGRASGEEGEDGSGGGRRRRQRRSRGVVGSSRG
ncbi:hypothetical protein [Oryza sativa Japonica Group]|uniref:Uncharacterized protein n=1 Tax=Oryza sativa subsp. japonica TaxID=39947 RepID=Q656Y7_ORYSJ|nr:hypothetical protein [Oryza sativa Japonica Group]